MPCVDIEMQGNLGPRIGFDWLFGCRTGEEEGKERDKVWEMEGQLEWEKKGERE